MQSPFTDSPEDLEGLSDEPGFAAPVFCQLVVNVEPGIAAPVFSQLKPGDRKGHQSHDRQAPPPPPRHAADPRLG